MTRNGKIARLPRHLRDELNLRLDDGEQGKDLVNWLNGLDKVKEVLAGDFGGRPITEQNLSEWKQGGFREWQRREEACERVRRLVEDSDDLDEAAEERSISDRLAGVLAAELAVAAQTLLEETADPKERWQYLRQVLRQLHLLRKGDHRAALARIETARWEIESERHQRQQENEAIEAARDEAMAPFENARRRPLLEISHGGGEAGEKAADYIFEVERRCREAKSSRPFFDGPFSLPSNPMAIQPNPTRSR